MNVICPVFSILMSVCINIQISQPYKSDGLAKISSYLLCVFCFIYERYFVDENGQNRKKDVSVF
jgi:hypothetical protein